MIFQFGIVALGGILATICVLAGHPEAAGAIGGASVVVFMLSML